MTRRTVLYFRTPILILFQLVLNLYFVSGQKRPNILWITIEDTSPHFIGSYGNSVAKTPNIDMLAREGVRFSSAFSTNTVCSPSRSTIITGVRTFETGTGHHRSAYPIPKFIKGFPYYLRKAGYYTSNNYKTDYNIANESNFIMDCWDESSKNAGWWNRKSNQPFFSVFNFIESHQAQTMTHSYESYKHDILSHMPEAERVKEEEINVPPFYLDSPEMRKQLTRVYNSLKLTDIKIGELISRLEREKLRDSTIIFFFSDHGEGIPRGKTNGINLGYRVPFIIWFPPAYKYLSPWGTSVVTDELIDFEDLAPTIIQLAAGSIPNYMKGRTLMGNSRSNPTKFITLSSDRSDDGIDMVRSITDGRYMYSRNYMPFMPEARFINYMEISEIKKIMRKDLRAGKLNTIQKSIFEPRPTEFLYDTKSDIWEVNNLADKPEFHKILTEMRRELDNSLERSRDIMFLPEYEMANISKYETLYKFRLSNKDYPFHKIYKAASLSGKRGKKYARQQIRLLKSKNKIQRYWAIIGLRSQNLSLLVNSKKTLIRMMNDPYPPVAITAAALSYEIFKDSTAEGVLKKFLLDKDINLVLLTGNFLLYSKMKEPFVPIFRSLAEDKRSDDKIKQLSEDYLISLE